MNTYLIFSPALAGMAEHQPSIKMDETYTSDSSNVRVYNGELCSVKNRLKEFYDSNFEKIETPTAYYPILAMDTATTTDTITIDGDLTTTFVNGYEFRINGSTASDGIYTVYSSTYDVANTNTIITVNEQITSSATLGNVFIGSTPILHYHTHISPTSSETIFVFTAYHIFIWDYNTRTLIPMFTCSNPASVSQWSTTTFNNGYVVATNNIDKVQYWSLATPSTPFAPLGTANGCDLGGSEFITQAKFVAEYNNYLLLLNITTTAGDCPQRIACSDLLDATVFNSGDAGQYDVEGTDAITAWGKYGDYFIVFKQNSIHKMWFTGDKTIFNISKSYDGVGCICPHSVCSDANGNLYYFSTNKEFCVYDTGSISSLVKATTDNIKDDLAYDIKSKYVKELGEVWFAIPTGSSALTNNKVLTYDFVNGVWSSRDLEVSAFGEWRKTEDYVWDTLPFDTWDEWSWDSWDNVATSAGYPLTIVGDYDGFTYTVNQSSLDDAVAYTSYAVLSTDFAQKGNLPAYKRWLYTKIYVYPEAEGTLKIECKRDNEKAWQTVGTVDISSTTQDLLMLNLPTSMRAKTFLIKVSSTNPFRLVGLYFKFETIGER